VPKALKLLVPIYLNIRFRFRPQADSVDSQTLNYLKSFSRECNQMTLEAIRAYWMPVACRERSFVKGEALKKLAFQAVAAMCSRARYLCATFELDPAAFGLSVSVVGVSSSGFPSQSIVTQASNEEEPTVTEEAFEELDGAEGYLNAADMSFNTAGL
jgi:hypothetical protein